MYYYQETTESGPFATPFPDQYETADTMRELKSAFYHWLNEVRHFSDEAVSVLVFKGEPEGMYPCACPPDFVLQSGPRDGCQVRPA